MVQEQAELARMRVQLRQVFTPGAPISKKDSLTGRGHQIQQMIEAVADAGKHAIVFGERGVGKTSLAGLIHDFWTDIMKDFDFIAPRVNCEPLDDYASVWANIADEFIDGLKDGNMPGDFEAYLMELRIGEATPNLIRRCLQACPVNAVIIIDEFDRLEDRDITKRFADTIKGLSDYDVEATLVLVGVADTIDELIEDHASIDRNLVQIALPRLTTKEIQEVISSRLRHVGMDIDDDTLQFLASLAQGLPYYAHLLGMTCGIAAVEQGRVKVSTDDLVTGLSIAINNAMESVRAAYHQATASTRRESLYREVLLACASTPVDELGFFAAGDVREPMGKIMGNAIGISKYLRQLGEFCTEGRGSVLQRSGPQWKQRYRFRDPLLKPYVLLKGLEAGTLKGATLADHLQ